MASTLTKQMEIELKAERARVAELEREQIEWTAAIERLQPEYDRACDLVRIGAAQDEASEQHSALAKINARQTAIVEELRNARRRVADLDSLVHAGQRGADAERAMKKATADAAVVEARIVEAERAAAGLRAMQASEQAAAAQAQEAMAHAHLAGLPDAVRQQLGISALDPSQPAPDPAAHDHRAAAVGAAADKLEAKIATMRSELADVRQTGAETEVELLRQRSLQAEVAHAAALVEYLPHLAALRKAHTLAHDYPPSLPDYETLADELPEAEPEPGVLRRLAGKVASVLS